MGRTHIAAAFTAVCRNLYPDLEISLYDHRNQGSALTFGKLVCEMTEHLEACTDEDSE